MRCAQSNVIPMLLIRKYSCFDNKRLDNTIIPSTDYIFTIVISAVFNGGPRRTRYGIRANKRIPTPIVQDPKAHCILCCSFSILSAIEFTARHPEHSLRNRHNEITQREVVIRTAREHRGYRDFRFRDTGLILPSE